MLIKIETLKEMINQLTIDRDSVPSKYEAYYKAGARDAKNEMLATLDELPYGKTYKCLNCGKDIHFVEKPDCKYYMHTHSGHIRCDGKNSLNWAYDEIAIPTPESLEQQEKTISFNWAEGSPKG